MPSHLISGDLILGDVIQSIDGKKVADMKDFLNIIEKHKLNDRITLQVLRKGRTRLKIPVTLFMQ